METRKITISKSELRSLQANEKFSMVLQLARYSNQLVFCGAAIDGRPQSDSPRDILITFNHLLFGAGILYEGLKLVQRLGKEFKHFPSYKKGFARMWSDPNTHYLREKFLNRVRNGLVYHIDAKPLEDALAWLDMDEFVFAATTDGRRLNTHFQLADDLAMNSIIGETKDDQEHAEKVRDLAERLSKLVSTFIDSTHQLIWEYAGRKQWKLEGHSDHTAHPRSLGRQRKEDRLFEGSFLVSDSYPNANGKYVVLITLCRTETN